MNKIKKIELLSPVGDERGLKAAVNSGANGVYFGAKSFNAREYAAENFDDKAIENAIKFAKLRNVKVYITVNTLVYNDEIDKAISLIKNIYNIPKNFNYHKLDDYESWKKIIGKIKRYSNYKEELKMRYLVKALNTYKEQNLLDNELGFIPEEGYEWEVSKERLDVLLGENGFGMKFVELVKEINLEEQENQTSNEETKEIEANEENKEIETATLKDKRNPRK